MANDNTYHNMYGWHTQDDKPEVKISGNMVIGEREKRIRSAIFDYDMAKVALKESQEILFYFAVEAGWNKEDKSDIRVARAYLEGLLNRSNLE